MKCLNCGADIEKELCKYCGTVNDFHAILKGAHSYESHVSEEHAFGEGNITEISREESDRIREAKFRKGEEEFKEIIKEEKKVNFFLPFLKAITSVYGLLVIFIIILSVIGYLRSRSNEIYIKSAHDIILKQSYGLIKNGQLTDGRDKLSEEIRFSKSHPNPYFYYFRGVYIYYIYLNEKLRSKEDKAMLEEMKDSLEQALKYEKLFPEAHFYLGMYYYELCDCKNAIAEFTLSIEEAGKKWKEDKKTSEKWISAAENLKKLSAFGSIKKEDIMPPFLDIDNKGKKLPEGNKINLPVPEGLF